LSLAALVVVVYMVLLRLITALQAVVAVEPY
jgi:hypothetical protein